MKKSASSRFGFSLLAGAALVAALLFSSGATTPARATEMGTLIHFPAKMDGDGWPEAEAAAADAAKTFGKSAWLRFEYLWHERHWEPFAPTTQERLQKIIGICKRNGLRPLTSLVPHPWPGSEWAAPWQPPRAWGDPDPRMFPWIAQMYAADVAQYRQILKEAGIAETDAAIQMGNEPAAGHPGGNDNLPLGTWSDSALWIQVNAAADYGALNVISPAISMQDHPEVEAARERTTAVIDADKWTAPITAWAFHNRVYRPDLSGEAYADLYTQLLAERVKTVGALWTKGDAKHAKMRARGLWVTEGYIASGDAGGVRADAVRAVAKRIKAGIPGLAVFIWYRWHPLASPDGTALEWRYDDASKAAIAEVVADPTIGTKPKPTR